MVGVAEGDQLVAVAVERRHQEGGLVGLGAAVGEEDLVQLGRGHRPDPLGELDLGADEEEGGGVDHPVELRLDRPGDLRERVPARNRGDTAEEVEVLAARPVVDVLPLAAADLDRGRVVETDAGEEALLMAADEVCRVVGKPGRGGTGLAEQVGHQG